MANIRRVAKEAGVSIATVSRVLNDNPSVASEIRTKVLRVVNRLGYVGSSRKPDTTCVGFAYTGPSSFSSPFDAMLMDGIGRAIAESDCDLVVLNLQRDKKPAETYSQYFLRKSVRGVILRTTAGTRGVCSTIAEEGFAAVVVGSRCETPGASYVYADSLSTSKQAVEHLIALGHRRIGITLSLIEDSDHIDRMEGYRQALIEHGIEPDPKCVFRVPAQRPDGAQLFKRVLSGANPPTAMFVTDPDVVFGMVNQAHRIGVRIPQDFSIVGMDDGDNRKDTYPQFTAVCQDAVQIGYEAFLALSRIIGSASKVQEPVRIAMPTWLEVHETTAPPPHQLLRVLPDGTRIA